MRLFKVVVSGVFTGTNNCGNPDRPSFYNRHASLPEGTHSIHLDGLKAEQMTGVQGTAKHWSKSPVPANGISIKPDHNPGKEPSAEPGTEPDAEPKPSPTGPEPNSAPESVHDPVP